MDHLSQHGVYFFLWLMLKVGLVQEQLDLLLWTPFGFFSGILSLAIVVSSLRQSKKKNALRLHILEIVNDMVNCVLSLAPSLHLVDEQHHPLFGPPCQYRFNSKQAFHAVLTTPCILLNQSHQAIESVSGVSGIKSPIGRALLMAALHSLPHVALEILFVIVQIVCNAFSSSETCLSPSWLSRLHVGTKWLSWLARGPLLAVQLAFLFWGQLKFYRRVRKAVNTYGQGPKSGGVSSANLKERKKEVRCSGILLVGTVGLNLVCVTVFILAALVSTILLALTVDRRITATAPYTLFTFFHLTSKALDSISHIFSDVNATMGVLFHVLCTDIFFKQFKRLFHLNKLLKKLRKNKPQAQVHPALNHGASQPRENMGAIAPVPVLMENHMALARLAFARPLAFATDS